MKEQDETSKTILYEMEISILSDKKYKVIVIKMFTEQESNEWTQWKLQQRNGKYKNILNGNHRAEEYNTQTEKNTLER